MANQAVDLNGLIGSTKNVPYAIKKLVILLPLEEKRASISFATAVVGKFSAQCARPNSEINL